MSDEQTATTDTTDLVDGAEDTQNDAPQGNPSGTDWKAEARKWEARAKAAKADSDDALKWREYEASLKPAQERLAEELAAAKAQADSATAQLLRYEVAAEKGITGEATALLKGNTRDELEAEADILLKLIASQSKTPRPDANQGKPATGGTATKDQFAAALDSIL
jgi:hypothetical protein